MMPTVLRVERALDFVQFVARTRERKRVLCVVEKRRQERPTALQNVRNFGVPAVANQSTKSSGVQIEKRRLSEAANLLDLFACHIAETVVRSGARRTF